MAEPLSGKKNFPKTEELKAAIDKMMYEQGQLDAKGEAYRDDCEVNRANITEIIKTAKKDLGVPAKVMRAYLKEEKAKSSVQKTIDALSDDDQSYLQATKDALGEYADTPLGSAAVEGDVTEALKGEEE